jgi:hypothetical protein
VKGVLSCRQGRASSNHLFNFKTISRPHNPERAISTLDDSGIQCQRFGECRRTYGHDFMGNAAGSSPFNSIDTYAQKTSSLFQYRGHTSTLTIAVYKESFCNRYSSEESTEIYSLFVLFALFALSQKPCSVLSRARRLDALLLSYLAGASLPFSLSHRVLLSICVTDNRNPVLKP